MLDAHRAQHDAVGARTEAAVDALHRAQAPARLDGNAQLCDAFERLFKAARLTERARKIDDVQNLRARVQPAAGAVHGVAVVGDLLAPPVQKAHGAPV